MLQKEIRILVVDDDPSIRNMLEIVLKKNNYDVILATDGREALELLKKKTFDLVISDIKMPDISGISLLQRLKTSNPEIPVIMITAFASTNDAVEAMKLGAEDYITKPFNLEELKMIIEKSLYKKDIERENIQLKQRLYEKEKFENIIGKSTGMKKIFELIDTIAATDSTVLIVGESGTGKELIAKAIHSKSKRSENKFVSINCGALPETLLESELFGHTKGAFTDAHREKVGLFQVADQGTLFLDEISEMSQNMQVKLLRALQEKRIRRVGSNEEVDIDVRIISATNKDLMNSIQKNEFRADLFYRLNVIPIMVPPLRERKVDIPLLMEYFLSQFSVKFDKGIEGFQKEVMDHFLNYGWPGNVRELENVVERAVALEKDNVLSLTSLPKELVYSVPHTTTDDLNSLLNGDNFHFNEYIDGIKKSIILKSLELNNFNIKKSAAMLKLQYRSLRHLIDKFQLKGKHGDG